MGIIIHKSRYLHIYILAHYLNHLSFSEAGGQGGVKGTCDMYPLHGVYGPVPIQIYALLCSCAQSSMCPLPITPVCHLDLCIIMPICPITHMTHYKCIPLPMCPITPVHHLDLCIIMPICPITHMPIVHVPHHPCPPSRSMHYYAHVPYCPCATLSMCPIPPVALPLYPIAPCTPIAHVLHHSCLHLDLCIIKQHTCSGYMSHVP